LKAASLAQIKKELKLRSSQDIEELCLRLGRFKKENKELLTYLLFEADDEQGYITHIKETIDDEFNSITNTNFYYLKKSVRKILKNVKKYIRYSNDKETEVAILLHFCERLITFKPSITRNITLTTYMIGKYSLSIRKLKPCMKICSMTTEKICNV